MAVAPAAAQARASSAISLEVSGSAGWSSLVRRAPLGATMIMTCRMPCRDLPPDPGSPSTNSSALTER